METVLMSAKTEALLQGKYRLKKMQWNLWRRQRQRKVTCKVHLRNGTSKGLFVGSLNYSIFQTGDKRGPGDKLLIRNNKLEHFTQKERI